MKLLDRTPLPCAEKSGNFSDERPPPNSGDIFTNVEYRDGRLVAWTWEGFMISIDPETGKPLEALFTK